MEKGGEEMPEERVTKVKPDTYEQIKAKAEAEGTTMADAAKKLIEQQAKPPTTCELGQFRRVLESRGLTPPRRTDWVWAMTDVLPADILEGTKLEPYADARREAELRCRLGDALYEELIEEGRSPETVEKPELKPQEVSIIDLGSLKSAEETE